MHVITFIQCAKECDKERLMTSGKTIKLIDDARAAGRKCLEDGGKLVVLHGKSDGVIVWPDRCITRYGIDLGISTRMTVAQARKILGLPA